jgi:hypothetical protein
LEDVFLRNYKVMSVGVGQYYLQLPPSYARTHNVQKGQRMFCYMSNIGELIFKRTEIPHNDHIMLNVYKVQLSGTQGLRLKVPYTYRDAFDITDTLKVSCSQTSSGDLKYKPIIEKFPNGDE